MRAAIEGFPLREDARGGTGAQARRIAAEIGIDLEDDDNFTAATRPTRDGLGVDGEGAHTDHEQLYVSSFLPAASLFIG